MFSKILEMLFLEFLQCPSLCVLTSTHYALLRHFRRLEVDRDEAPRVLDLLLLFSDVELEEALVVVAAELSVHVCTPQLMPGLPFPLHVVHASAAPVRASATT